MVALDFAVALRRARRDAAVLDAARGEQLAQRAVVDVGEGVVGLEAFGLDAVAGEEAQRPLDEAGDGLGLLVAVDLGEDEPRVVVDDRVAELPADSGLAFLPER